MTHWRVPVDTRSTRVLSAEERVTATRVHTAHDTLQRGCGACGSAPQIQYAQLNDTQTAPQCPVRINHRVLFVSQTRWKDTKCWRHCETCPSALRKRRHHDGRIAQKVSVTRGLICSRDQRHSRCGRDDPGRGANHAESGCRSMVVYTSTRVTLKIPVACGCVVNQLRE